MRTTSLPLSVSACRRRGIAGMMLVILVMSSLPAVSFAQQQPRATITALTGSVMVNGQPRTQGANLRAGDVLETQAGTGVTLTLSDGSILEIGEKTRIDITELSQTPTGTRVSRIKLLWGRIRGALSPGHQKAGSTFDVETPNALVGVKFSHPKFEVIYNLGQQETRALAMTIQLMVKNLLTGETQIVPVGSTAIIAGALIKIASGLISTGAVSAGTGGGLGIGTTVLGLAALGGAGYGVATLLKKEDKKQEETPPTFSFTGKFLWSSGGNTFKRFELVENGTNINGTLTVNEPDYCSGSFTVNGSVGNSNTATLYLTDLRVSGCRNLERTLHATLESNGNLFIDEWGEFTRQ
jgi:hypothetical protein